MQSQSLMKWWDAKRSIDPLRLKADIADQGVILGAGTILARSLDTPRPASERNRLVALLAVAYDGKVSASAPDHLEAAAQWWRRGEKAVAHIRLAYARLPPLRDEADAYRLSLADLALAGGATPDMLIKELCFSPKLLALLKFDPGQPRVPAGQPDGGQWTGTGDDGEPPVLEGRSVAVSSAAPAEARNKEPKRKEQLAGNEKDEAEGREPDFEQRKEKEERRALDLTGTDDPNPLNLPLPGGAGTSGAGRASTAAPSGASPLRPLGGDAGAAQPSESVAGGAQSALAAPALSTQLAAEAAASVFTLEGFLSGETLAGATEIIKYSALKNPAIPSGFSKFKTKTYRSPSGDFHLHFYMNPFTRIPFYDLDYKTIFNKGIRIMKVRCIKDTSSLTAGREYLALEIYGPFNALQYRLIGDDNDTAAIYDASLFEIISPKMPASWVFKRYSDDFWILTPKDWSDDGFWQAFFDQDEAAEATFARVLAELQTEANE